MTDHLIPPQEMPTILVVDDTPANLQLLAGMLKDRGYRPRPVTNGKFALQAAKNDPPALILLDINMPEMNGYEVCEQLKADPLLAEIPVIFISALNETVDKVRAFSVGGVDYVTKPFQFEEVEARVATHLELRRQKRLAQESYEQLRKLEELRDNLVHMIIHDMRTPLTSISGFLQTLEQLEAETMSADAREFIGRALASTCDLIDMVGSLLDVSKMEAGEMTLHLEPCCFADIAGEVLRRAESLREDRRLTLLAPAELPAIMADPELMTRVIQNLLGNALKFTPADGEITLGIEPGQTEVRVYLRDTGPGIPPEYRERIFEKFGQVEARKHRQKYSTGLGLNFCKLAVEAHGGTIDVDSEVGVGSTFWFILPLTREPAPRS